MTDDELRKLALDYHRLTDGGTCRLMATPVNHAGQLARRLLELLPAVGVGVPEDVRADAEHVAGCTEDWCHAAGEADLFEAVRRGQRVAAAWLKEHAATYQPNDRVRLTVPGSYADLNSGTGQRLGVTLVFQVIDQDGDAVQVKHSVTGRRYVLPAKQLTRVG